MSGESDLIKLYSARILELAASMPHTGRLAHAQASVTKRAPLCGSTVTVDIVTDGGTITDYAADVKACALGQAAASVVGTHVIGRTPSELRVTRDALKSMLADGGPTPPAPFEELEVLRAASDFANRHASILLTLDALVEATDTAQTSCA
ncbi:MAG: iron-sulfur cluster assembly scaffold protein [Pseudomonadota bacterium]